MKTIYLANLKIIITFKFLLNTINEYKELVYTFVLVKNKPKHKYLVKKVQSEKLRELFI